MTKRKSFVVYTDLDDSLASFTDAEVGSIFRAMLTYAREGRETDLSAREAVAFGFIKAQMDRDADKYDDIVEKRKAAVAAREEKKKTGENKRYQVVSNDNKSNQVISSDSDNDNVNVTENENANANESENGILPPKPPTGGSAQKRFSPPTVEMVAEYCKERHNGVDAQRFVDYYSANGWKVGGRSAMKDWKAAVRTWEGNGYGSATVATQKTEAAPVNKYAPAEGTIAAASFNRMLERAKQYASEREATE